MLNKLIYVVSKVTRRNYKQKLKYLITLCFKKGNIHLEALLIKKLSITWTVRCSHGTSN